MTGYIVAVFKELGKYTAHCTFDSKFAEIMILQGQDSGYELVYRGRVRTEEQDIALNKFLTEANNADTFDKDKLEEILK